MIPMKAEKDIPRSMKINLANRTSFLNPEKRISDVALEMLEFVIDQEVREPPYIAFVTKQQLAWGDGPHWKAAPPYLKAGVRKNANVRQPSDADISRSERLYGYTALVKPTELFSKMFNVLVRQHIQMNTLSGKGFSDIRVLTGKGYIN